MTLFRRDLPDADPTCPMCSDRIVDRQLAVMLGWLVALGSLALWLIHHRIVNAALYWLMETLPSGCAP